MSAELYSAETTSLGDIMATMHRKGQIGNFVEPEGPKWQLSPQTDPKWKSGIRSRGRIGIRGDKMEYLRVEGTNWNITHLPVGLSRGKVKDFFYLDRFLLRSVWEIAAEPSEYRAPHQDFGRCREIGAKTHWGSIRSHFCARPAPRPADAKATVAECTCTVYGTRV